MNDKLLETFLNTTYTKNQALNRLGLLKVYLINQLFGATNKKEFSIDPDELLGERGKWLYTLDKEFFKAFNRKNVYKLIEELTQEINKINPLTIYLSFEPPEEYLAQMSEYLRQNYGPNFLFEIKLDPNLVGGAALIWNGVYKDFSVRQTMNEQKDEILGTLEKFLGP